MGENKRGYNVLLMKRDVEVSSIEKEMYFQQIYLP